MKFINPIVAAMMHVVGSLLVVFNSARLVRHGEELEPFHGAPVPSQGDKDAPARPKAAPLAPKPA
jgi:hypothetical protein